MLIKKLARKTFLDISGIFKRPSLGIHILNGHFVQLCDNNHNFEIFYGLLKNLSRNFQFVDLEEACHHIYNQKIPSKPIITFTFDDGLATCYNDIAPALEAFGTRGAFFINPSVIEASIVSQNIFLENSLKLNVKKEFMTWKEIQDLHEKGHIIGNHTMNHKALVGLSFHDAHQEVMQGKQILETRLKFECKYFALPYGTPEYFDQTGLNAALACHDIVLTGCTYQRYSYQDKRVLNRRHFEGNWPHTHINYFTSVQRVM